MISTNNFLFNLQARRLMCGMMVRLRSRFRRSRPTFCSLSNEESLETSEDSPTSLATISSPSTSPLHPTPAAALREFGDEDLTGDVATELEERRARLLFMSSGKSPSMRNGKRRVRLANSQPGSFGGDDNSLTGTASGQRANRKIVGMTIIAKI